jgi:hypothetical protein
MAFGRPVQVLAVGCGDERAADRDCSATMLRRRRDECAGKSSSHVIRAKQGFGARS